MKMKKIVTMVLALTLFVNTLYGQGHVYILEESSNQERFIKVSLEQEEGEKYLLFEFCNAPEDSSCEIYEYSVENFENAAELLRQENDRARKVPFNIAIGGAIGGLLSTGGIMYSVRIQNKNLAIMAIVGAIISYFLLLVPVIKLGYLDLLLLDTTLTRLQTYKQNRDEFILIPSKNRFDMLWEELKAFVDHSE